MKNESPKRRSKKSQQNMTAEELKLHFDDQLRQRYWAEKSLLDLLPKLAKKATSYELAIAIDEHLSISEKQLVRLIKIFGTIEERAVPVRCARMESCIKEAEFIISNSDAGYKTDAAIIDVCGCILSDEIQSYNSLHKQATALGETEAAEHLLSAVFEEQNAKALMTQIMLSAIYFDEAG